MWQVWLWTNKNYAFPCLPSFECLSYEESFPLGSEVMRHSFICAQKYTPFLKNDF